MSSEDPMTESALLILLNENKPEPLPAMEWSQTRILLGSLIKIDAGGHVTAGTGDVFKVVSKNLLKENAIRVQFHRQLANFYDQNCKDFRLIATAFPFHLAKSGQKEKIVQFCVNDIRANYDSSKWMQREAMRVKITFLNHVFIIPLKFLKFLKKFNFRIWLAEFKKFFFKDLACGMMAVGTDSKFEAFLCQKCAFQRGNKCIFCGNLGQIRRAFLCQQHSISKKNLCALCGCHVPFKNQAAFTCNFCVLPPINKCCWIGS